ncbi:MAG: hypothetical protein KF694_01820 [Mesorhizobium sp.]|nr:hypothetical protein [Mesorhizobium sp.]
MRFKNEYELDLYLTGLFEGRLQETANVIRQLGGTPEEVAAMIALQRDEMDAAREEIMKTSRLFAIDPDAAAHLVQ